MTRSRSVRVDLERERVELVRTVEGHRRDAVRRPRNRSPHSLVGDSRGTARRATILDIEVRSNVRVSSPPRRVGRRTARTGTRRPRRLSASNSTRFSWRSSATSASGRRRGARGTGARFAEAGFDPAQLASLDDLRRIPLLTREEWMASQAEHPPYGEIPAICRRRRDPRPHDVGHDRPRPAARARLAQGLGLDRGDVVLRDLGLRRAARRHGLHRVRLRLVHRLLGPALRDGEDRGAQRARAARSRPRRGCARSSTSAPPSSRRRRRTRCGSRRRPSLLGIDLPGSAVQRLILSGEPAGSIPQTKALIEEQWGAKAFDTAGMTEIGTIMVFECADQPGGTHIIEDHFIEEVIDPATLEPVAYGRAGRARRHVVRPRRDSAASATARGISCVAFRPRRARAGAASTSTRAASSAASTT